jgi:predicted alpha/beta hydrolase family esterase
VASMNDPYCAMQRAVTWAAYWGSRFISIGNRGHINSQSGLENWEEGWSILKQLENMTESKSHQYINEKNPGQILLSGC